jgi:hypothetical protein
MQRMLVVLWSVVLMGSVAHGGLPHPGVADEEALGSFEARLTCDAGATRVRLEVNGEPRAVLSTDVVRCASEPGGACRFSWDECDAGNGCDRSIVVVKPDTELSLAELDSAVVFVCRATPTHSAFRTS